jgi:hypothetical protein
VPDLILLGLATTLLRDFSFGPAQEPFRLERHPHFLRFPAKGELGMEQRRSITSRECRRRADEAQTLAAQTQDDWERELLQRITTQWDLLAAIRKAKKGGRKTFQSKASNQNIG